MSGSRIDDEHPTRPGLQSRTDEYPDRAHAELWSAGGLRPSVRAIGEGIGVRLPPDRREYIGALAAPAAVLSGGRAVQVG